jgi:hypothetical protein
MTLCEYYESIIIEFDPENQDFYHKVLAGDLYIVLKLIYNISEEDSFKERVFILARDIGRFGEKFVESEFKNTDGNIFTIIGEMSELQSKYNFFTDQIRLLS